MLLGDMSAAELKKQQRKQKKAQHKAAAQAAEEEKEKKGVCSIDPGRLSWVYNVTLAECCISVAEMSYCKQLLYAPS